MLKDSKAFSGYSVDDIARAKAFYGNTLGLDVNEMDEGLELKISGSNSIFLYPKPNHQPATFTVLNFPVPDLEPVLDELVSKGVKFEHYDTADLKTDAKGIMDGKALGIGPKVAWFTDPAGNILSLMEM